MWWCIGLRLFLVFGNVWFMMMFIVYFRYDWDILLCKFVGIICDLEVVI